MTITCVVRTTKKTEQIKKSTLEKTNRTASYFFPYISLRFTTDCFSVLLSTIEQYIDNLSSFFLQYNKYNMDDEQLTLLPDLSDFGKIYKIPLFLKYISLCLVLPSTWEIEDLLSNYLGK